jgi:hypothetical protein
MATEEQKIVSIANDLLKYLIPDISKATLRQYTNAVTAITDVVKSDAAKEYHTKGMYTEAEVEELCRDIYVESSHNRYNSFEEWFEHNKKK